MYWRRIRLAKRSKSFRSSRLMLFSVVMGVGINFKPRESRMICSSVSCSFDRFLMCFCVTQLCCCNAFSLCFYCVLFSFSWKPFYLLLFPLFLKTQIINGDKIHIVYSQERFWLHSKLRQVRWSWLLEFLLAYVSMYITVLYIANSWRRVRASGRLC